MHGLLGPRLRRRVERRRVGAQRRALVDLDERLAGEQRRLGTDVHDAPHAGLARGLQHVARALHVAVLEVRAGAPVAAAAAAGAWLSLVLLLMKSPHNQRPDSAAREMTEEFIAKYAGAGLPSDKKSKKAKAKSK